MPLPRPPRGLTAAVLQKVGGQPLAGDVQAQLVQPLGMTILLPETRRSP
jgi:CubicO group peptidase (beta-lactamase class C family)